MEIMTAGEIARLCGARICGVAEDTPISGISPDSRTVAPGQLFVPLVAARDGHEFIGAARAAGAAATLSTREGNEPGTLYVDDTQAALMRIARGYRLKMPARVTALTGSVGKTTTKEMTAAVLSQAMPALKTEKNYNNAIGVPLTLLCLAPEHRAAVVEMGMNHFGEIAALTETARPDVGLITNVGVAHIEFLGSREGIASAKLELCEGMTDGSPIILNGDEPLLRDRPETARLRPVYFGMGEDCGVRALDIAAGAEDTAFTVVWPGGSERVRIPALGRHFVADALAAFAVGLEYGMSPEDISAGLAAFRSPRQQVRTEAGFVIIDDCYNANPDSMAAALRVLGERRVQGRRIAVLGDMLELGAHSAAEHEKTCAMAAEIADAVFLYGPGMRAALSAAGAGARCFATHGELAAALSRYAEPGDTLLFKGSRGMRMEDVIEAFLQSK